MASFDIIQASGAGYKLAWDERGYLLKLAAVPCLIKVVCFTVIVLLEWHNNYVRQALVMLPSYFADGWFLSHLVRFVFFEQRWPYRPTGDTEKDMAVLQDRALGIMRGTLMLVVIKFLQTGMSGLVVEAGQVTLDMPQEQIGLGLFVLSLSFLVFFFWAFRLLWLYIPAAINYPIRRYMLELGGYGASWHLIGVWMLCFLPAFFVLGKLIAALTMPAGDVAVGFDRQLIAVLLHTLLDTSVSVFVTASMAIGLKSYVFKS